MTEAVAKLYSETMTIDKKLLATLRCPVTKRPLRLMTREAVDKLNRAIGEGQVHFADGRPVQNAIDHALVTDNTTNVYTIDDGIPVMFEDDSIPCAQLGDLLD